MFNTIKILGPIVGPGRVTRFDKTGFRPEGDPGPVWKPGERPYQDPEDEEDFEDDNWPEAAKSRSELPARVLFGEPIPGGRIYPVAPGYKTMGAWFGEPTIKHPGHVIILKTKTETEIAADPDNPALSAAKWWRDDPTPGLKGVVGIGSGGSCYSQHSPIA